MHPSISAVPSRLFYNGRLQDGPEMDQRTKQVWHSSPLFGPYQFFDVAHGQEEAQSNHSQINRREADAAVALYDRLTREFKTIKFDYRIGIVSMYRGQVLHIKSRFAAVYGPAVLKLVDFNTVDGFQGQEKDIIILSCVRAGTNVQTVGFLADERRMNVALTRSRSSLFILGHAATLERCNQTWKTVVEDARTRGYLIKVSQAVTSNPMFNTNQYFTVLRGSIPIGPNA
jgi:senataxin